jgi:aryl-alcohol dehydrogenase-like predicted oxidoreductase
MRYTTLGSTGFQVSSLCLGTMTFAREADPAAARSIYQRCREAGVNFIDCADIYSEGAAERLLGEIIRDERDSLVITSKVGMQGGLGRDNIAARVERSLRNLQTDRLDVCFCHRFDPDVPVEETLGALDSLVQAGKIRAIGVSNWAAWQIALALGAGRSLGLACIQVIQPMYNLAKRTAEIEILPLARAQNLGVITYSPLGGGLLTGKYDGAASADSRLNSLDTYSRRYAEQVNFDIARRLAEHARATGVHPATLAVAWVAAHPAVSAPIIGARNVGQLEPALAAAGYTMSAEEWRLLAGFTPPVPPATDRTEEAPVFSPL